MSEGQVGPSVASFSGATIRHAPGCKCICSIFRSTTWTTSLMLAAETNAYSRLRLRQSEMPPLPSHRSRIQPRFQSILSTFKIFSFSTLYDCTKQSSKSASSARSIQDFLSGNCTSHFLALWTLSEQTQALLQTAPKFWLCCLPKHFEFCVYLQNQGLCRIVFVMIHETTLQ